MSTHAVSQYKQQRVIGKSISYAVLIVFTAADVIDLVDSELHSLPEYYRPQRCVQPWLGCNRNIMRYIQPVFFHQPGFPMIYSMTGFAVASAEMNSGSLTLELRAVNHRYLDLQLRMPDELRSQESALRETIATQLTRGKVECRIGYSAHQTAQNPALLNKNMVQQLALWSTHVREIFPDARDLSVADILHWNGVLEIAAISSETLHHTLQDLLKQVLQEFAAARQREGEKLKSFMLERVAQIEALRINVAPRIPASIAAYEAKLRTRLLEALGSEDDERVRQEITLYASKIDVDEELSRLQTHLDEVQRVLAKGGAVGKRLDFLMQELHREANTLGSKSVDGEVSRCAMDIKILIEQMREQVQNIE
jgi:uncharacterized protein (TIGR00255 family)